MKIALLCSGVGRVQRGFERLVLDLFELFEDDLDITLFKGGGPRGARQLPVFNASRHGWLVRLVPVHRCFRRSPYWSECWSFALAVFPRLLRGGFDVVHYIDPPMGRVLDWLRRRFRASFRLLYTQGSRVEPRFYPPFDHVHQISLLRKEQAIAGGIAADRMTLVPCGIHADRFVASTPRDELRQRYGISRDTFVVLCVSALNREQKRLDHVVAEVARVASSGDVFLWLDGNPEDPDIPRLARELLGERCRITHVPSREVPNLYGLADLLVHGSVEETFGLVVAEAMCAGLPVITHDSTHFRWLVGESACLADMRQPGALAAAIGRLAGDATLRRSLGTGLSDSARRRFDWSVLKPAYTELYRRVAAI